MARCARSTWLCTSLLLALATGAEDFAAPVSRGARALTAAIILPGYVLNLGVLWWSRRGRRTGELDERDEIIARRASEATLTILAVLVLAGSIALFETHAEVGTVPVGWLYFMAYGTMARICKTAANRDPVKIQNIESV